MPNGSHGGGEISREELLRSLDSFHGDPVVGELVVAPSQDRREVVASDVKHLIQSVDQELFLIEKIDVEKIDGHVQTKVGDALVIHLWERGSEPIENVLRSGRLRWLHVTEDRSTFRELEKLWRGTITR